MWRHLKPLLRWLLDHTGRALITVLVGVGIGAAIVSNCGESNGTKSPVSPNQESASQDTQDDVGVDGGQGANTQNPSAAQSEGRDDSSQTSNDRQEEIPARSSRSEVARESQTEGQQSNEEASNEETEQKTQTEASKEAPANDTRSDEDVESEVPAPESQTDSIQSGGSQQAGNDSQSCPDPSADGELIRQQDERDVYVLKVINCKAFKRLILSNEVIQAYGHLRSKIIDEVSEIVLSTYRSSTLAGFVRSDGRLLILHLHVTGEDTGERRLIDLTEGEIERAGLDLDSVFIINRGEFDIWQEGRTYETVSEVGEVVAAQGRD